MNVTVQKQQGCRHTQIRTHIYAHSHPYKHLAICSNNLKRWYEKMVNLIASWNLLIPKSRKHRVTSKRKTIWQLSLIVRWTFKLLLIESTSLIRWSNRCTCTMLSCQLFARQKLAGARTNAQLKEGTLSHFSRYEITYFRKSMKKVAPVQRGSSLKRRMIFLSKAHGK